MSAITRLVTCAIYAISVSAEQPSAPAPPTASLRELPWGQLNFLHTTDIHGWFAGHLQEAQYSADWGDYISFATHLRQRAEEDGSDLLVVDTGDRVEGNGLYDASNPKGKYLSDIVKRQRIDVITSGNHELYIHNTSTREYDEAVRNFKNSYLASNIDIVTKTGDRKPLAPRFRRFTTKNQGIRIIAFGFLYDFHGNADNTIVQDVEDTIKEAWFQDAIGEKDVDLFLVAGHVPVRDSKETELLYKAIRQKKWDTPIAFLGGHTHIRDYRKFESKAWALESGRYMETIGFMSISGLNSEKKQDVVNVQQSVEFKRLYIDNNLHSLHHHSGKNKSAFATEEGKVVSEAIANARKELKLDHAFGCAPKTFWLNRAPYPSNESLVTLLETEILPEAFEKLGRPAIAVVNTGALRFDVFKGPFTVDSTFLVSPFTSGFRVIKDVPLKVASQVLGLLNNAGPITTDNLRTLAEDVPGPEAVKLPRLLPAIPPQAPATDAHDFTQRASSIYPQQRPIRNKVGEGSQTPGYTTHDDGGGDGDDTIHQRIAFYSVPNCIAPGIGFSGHANAEVPDTVDLAYNEFIENWILVALKYLGESRTEKDTSPILDGTSMTTMISEWVRNHWSCKS